MGKEQVPASVAPEHFQTQQGFVAFLAPELSSTFEAALGLSAGRFHRATANRFTRSPSGAIVHARLMFVEVMDFLGDH